MKLQNLLIIFIIIALPVIIILSVYVEYQVDTATLRASYDSILLGSTYDTMLAFQLNSTNNKYSTVSDSLIRDIEASINIFSTSLATSLGVSGSAESDMLTYVPALLFTLYDGYYIYAPTTTTDGSAEYELKPYVYYTKEYSNSDNRKIIINFSLDNYVVVYYDNKTNGEYTSKAGYLEVIASDSRDNGVYYNASTKDIYYNGVKIEQNETLKQNKYTYATNSNGTIENFNVSEVNTTSTSAYDYYKNAYEFTNWYNGVIEEALRGSSDYDVLYIDENNSAIPDSASDFNNEKINVIEDIIKNNLIQAMEMYSRKTTIDFAMPELTAEDWNQILHNVCIISFIQGLPLGTTTYNDYVIVSSTENGQYVSETDIYYVGYDENGVSDGYYHRLGCDKLEGKTIVGYNKSEFSKQTAIGANNTQLKELVDGKEKSVYYYPHNELACYYCVISASDSNIEALSTTDRNYDTKILAYYRALAREKNNLVKLSDYVNGSIMQKK